MAFAIINITLGNASRYKPVADATTSTRGRFNSLYGITSVPRKKPFGSHFGFTPIAYNTWLSSTP